MGSSWEVRKIEGLQRGSRGRPVPGNFAELIEGALRFGHAAYRVLDNKTIAPFGTKAERQAVDQAAIDLSASEFRGAKKHLIDAAEKLTAGENADSIRESIHAVESVIRVLEPDGNFAKALAKLETRANIHGALKTGFNAIYGFTSDEKGIRHSLLEKGDAMLMKLTPSLCLAPALLSFPT